MHNVKKNILPNRSGGHGLWEGSIKGTSFLWSPQIKKGYISDQLMHITDWLPTILSIADYSTMDLLNIENLDGFNHWSDLVHGDKPNKRNKILLNYDPISKIYGYRYYKWKLIVDNSSEIKPKKEGRKRKFTTLEDSTKNLSAKLNEKNISHPTIQTFIEAATEQNKYKEFMKTNMTLTLKNILKELRKIYKRSTLKYLSSEENKSLKSDISRSLHKLDRKYKGEPLKINCKINETTSINCKNGGCLFNLEEDPCERVNLAEKDEYIFKSLYAKLKHFKKSKFYRNVLNKNSKESSWPIYHGGRWIQWGDSRLKNIPDHKNRNSTKYQWQSTNLSENISTQLKPYLTLLIYVQLIIIFF